MGGEIAALRTLEQGLEKDVEMNRWTGEVAIVTGASIGGPKGIAPIAVPKSRS
jgi:hypothetical protein